MFGDNTIAKNTKDLKVTVSRPNWQLMVNEVTQKKFSNFYKVKNGMIERMHERFHRLKLGGDEVLKFRRDNAGEDKKLEKRINSKECKLKA